MKTVDKAMTLLDQFSLDHTEIGLSEMARLSGLDKAATHRLLIALGEHGFVEQSAETRKYRLGNGFLRLARIREATVPLERAAQEVVDWLVAETGETTHVSIPGPHAMTTLAYRLPRRGHVVNIIAAEPLPFHATASGLIYLAHAPATQVSRVLSGDLDRFTAATVTDPAALAAMIDEFRKQGHSLTRSLFEDDVASIAMSFYRVPDTPSGSIALALPQEDLTDARVAELLPLLSQAVSQLETALTGLSHASA